MINPKVHGDGSVTPPSKRGRRKVNKQPDALTFIKKLLYHPDGDKAAKWLTEHATLLWDKLRGSELAEVSEALGKTSHELDTAQRTLDKLEEHKAGTPRFIKTSKVSTGEDRAVVPFKDWHRRDQILIWMLVAFIVACMGMGWSNVYSNLMASGEPVIIENTWLAAALAALAPLASVSVKWMTHFFQYDKSRRRYAIAVFTATLGVLAVWSVLFVRSFPGIASPVLLDMDGGFDTSALLTWSQLALEVLVAACLWLAAEDIWIKYAPGWYVENIEHIELAKAIDQLKPTLDELHQRHSTLMGRKTELEADRQAYVNDTVASFYAEKARAAQFNFDD